MKKILYIIVFLAGVAGFFLFSSPGLDILKGLPESHRKAIWAPFAFYNIGRLHESMGRYDSALEMYDEMLKTYDRRKSGQYVEHELSKHYTPYALYRKGVCLKKMGDQEYNLSVSLRKEGKNDEAAESLRLSRRSHQDASLVFREFIDKHAYHKLYPDANRLYSELQAELTS